MKTFNKFIFMLTALLGTALASSPEGADFVSHENPPLRAIDNAGKVTFSADIVKDPTRYIDIISSESGSSSTPEDQAILDIHHFLEHKVEADTTQGGDWFSNVSIDRSVNLDIGTFLTDSFMYGQESLFNENKYSFNKSLGSSRLLPAFIDLNIDTYFVSGKNIELFIIPRQNYGFSPISDYTASFELLAEFAVSVRNALNFPADMEVLNLPFLIVDGQVKGLIEFTNQSTFRFVCDPNANISFSKNSNSLKLEMPQQNYIKDIQFLSLVQSNSIKTIGGVDTPTYVGGSPYTLEFYSIDNNYTPDSLLKSALGTYETRPNKIIDFNIKQRTFQVKSSIIIEQVWFNEADDWHQNDYYSAMLNLTRFDGLIFSNQDPVSGNKQLTREPINVSLSDEDFVKRDYYNDHVVTTYNMPNSLFENGAQFIVVSQLNYHLMTEEDIYYLSSSFMHSKYVLKAGAQVDLTYSVVKTTNDWLNGWKILGGKRHSDQIHNVYLYHDEDRTMPIRNILDIEMHYQVGANRNLVAPEGEGSNSFSVEDGQRVYFNPLHSSRPLSFTHNLAELSDAELAHAIAPVTNAKGIWKVLALVAYGSFHNGPLKTYIGSQFKHYNDLQQVTMDLDGSSTGEYARINKKYGITKNSGKIENVAYWDEINSVYDSSRFNIPQVVFYNSIPMQKDNEYYVNWMAPAAIHYVNLEEKSVVPGSFWSDGRHIEFMEDGVTPIGVFDQFGNLIEDLKPTKGPDGNYIITDHNGHYKEPDNSHSFQEDKNNDEDLWQSFLKLLAEIGKWVGIALGGVLLIFIIYKIVGLIIKNRSTKKAVESAIKKNDKNKKT